MTITSFRKAAFKISSCGRHRECPKLNIHLKNNQFFEITVQPSHLPTARFCPKNETPNFEKIKKATDKVALISERYLAGGLSCLLKASLV